MRPVAKLILVEVREEKKAEGILIMPDRPKDYVTAIVNKIGESVSIPVKMGDEVIIRFSSGFKFLTDAGKEKCRIINECDVIAVEEDTKWNPM